MTGLSWFLGTLLNLGRGLAMAGCLAVTIVLALVSCEREQ